MPHLDSTVEAVLIQIAFVTVAILAAWIILGLLKGSAQVKQKGIQFGGAAAMFIAVFFLLNRYVPAIRDGIISEARASQSQQIITRSDSGSADTLDVYLSPDQQIITMRDLHKLDKNKYYVDEGLGLAVIRPSDPGWNVGMLQSFDRIRILDAPMLGSSVSSIRAMMPIGSLASSVFAVNSNRVHTIVLNGDSEIAGIRLDINPFADEQFLRSAIEAQLSSAALMANDPAPNDPDSREKAITLLLTTTRDALKNGAEQLIKKTLPLTKKVQNGVYVMELNIEQLPSAAGWIGQVMNSMTVLDRAFTLLSMNGLLWGGGRNIKVDQLRRIASFNGSLELHNVLVDDRKTDVRLNDIGFLVGGDRSVLYVQLLSLDIDGIGTSLFLKRVMDSLLFVI